MNSEAFVNKLKPSLVLYKNAQPKSALQRVLNFKFKF